MPQFAGLEYAGIDPLLRGVTPAVVNISVRGRVREQNPLWLLVKPAIRGLPV
jgi:hypothetical protein